MYSNWHTEVLNSQRTQNWILYYALLQRYLKELMPIVYTPTEVITPFLKHFIVIDQELKAEAIANYSHLFRRSEGLYLSIPHADTMEQDFLDQIKGRDIDLVVCSDAEAILGIGDQGVGSIGVSLPTSPA